MGKINLLSFEVANLIAAGEVVDRPASAIKELMENSIDAGAKHITVEIKNGGITFMRVSDDGCGMEPDDIPMAVRRHATSKISSAADLDGICTLGFRGEALAAIASVSKLRIISKTRNSVLGAALDINCGEPMSLREQGCSDGTTVIAEELFANVPARRKFLKRDVTETTAVCANVEKVALSHPEISFRLITDGQMKLETMGDGILKNTIYSVFGKDFSSRLIEVNSDYDGIGVKGFVGRSDNVKGNRNYQNFYINNRFVKSKTATAALEQAFVSYLPSERFPVCVLFLSLNPGRVDVNVHPAKLEVKFSNEKPVFEAIYYGVRQALEKNITRPELEFTYNNSRTDNQNQNKRSGMRMSDAFAPVERDGKATQLSMESLDFPTKKHDSQSSFESIKDKDRYDTHYNIKQNRDVRELSNAAVPQTRETSDSSFQRITAKEYLEQYLGLTHSVNQSPTPDDSVSQGSTSDGEHGLTHSVSQGSTSDGEYGLTHSVNQYPTPGGELEKTYSVIPGELSKKQSTETQNGDALIDQLPSTDKNLSNTEVLSGTEQINVNDVTQSVTDIPTQEAQTAFAWRLVGEVFNSYLLVECRDKLLIVDKHAAHERIIFEQLKSNMYKSESYSQIMMFPIDVMLMSDEVSAIEEYRKEIEKIGFGFESSKNTVSVSEIPSGIEPSAVPDMLAVIADRIKSGTGDVGITRNILFEKALYQASCKAAIKAGREYPVEYEKWIVEQLQKIPDITFCPHGRPVAMELSKKNMDRQFERT